MRHRPDVIIAMEWKKRSIAYARAPGTRGYIAADQDLIDVIRSFAPASFPPPRCRRSSSPGHSQASGTSDVIRQTNRAAAGRALKLKQSVEAVGLQVMPSITNIVPFMVGDPVKAKRISDLLLRNHGRYVQPINYPTVPRGTERLRFTPGPTTPKR